MACECSHFDFFFFLLLKNTPKLRCCTEVMLVQKAGSWHLCSMKRKKEKAQESCFLWFAFLLELSQLKDSLWQNVFFSSLMQWVIIVIVSKNIDAMNHYSNSVPEYLSLLCASCFAEIKRKCYSPAMYLQLLSPLSKMEGCYVNTVLWVIERRARTGPDLPHSASRWYLASTHVIK